MTFPGLVGPQGGVGVGDRVWSSKDLPFPSGQMVSPQTLPGSCWGHLGNDHVLSLRCWQCLVTQLRPDAVLGVGSCV